MRRLLLLFTFFISFSNANILQEAINNAEVNSILKLPNGIYHGNIKINKPLTIIAKGKNVIIQGENKNSVIEITSSNVILKNLLIQGSGNRLDARDAGIKISNSNNSKILNCTIKDSLYGIDMGMVTNSIIENNYITSKDLEISLRGNALKLYYSNNNIIRNNEIYNTKDVIFSYSHNNLITQNHIEKSRFGLHFLKSNNNIIDNNHFQFNSVGLIFGGAKDTTVKNNMIKSSIGKAGIGILIKGVSNFVFKDNVVTFNSKAFYIDAKHNETSIKRFITDNEISYNMEAFHFHGAIKQNLIKRNTIIGNIDDVVKSVRGNATSKNIVEENYWDHYSGFDKNNDNIGDTSYRILQYADRLWHYNNKVKFFYATPIISILNFILSLAPFIEPVVLLEDTKPIVELK
ncbi:nitrous oxide reductase family maturation protein NosD [Arcobacter sp. LA11]|uniref:nitrous oxide reductase family maturation protein NosD n=1 Tax=Arcobacter sp. LA11 TaxID=1898176 RepID=UPI0009349176|nr:nitrous oxide reductase family maturation protein NosD [Arcobacter sp. LA11]